MRGGGKAKKPENVTWRDNQQMERSEERQGAPTERQREATGQQDSQLNKWGTIARQKVEALAEVFNKAERMADKRWRRNDSGATTTMTIL